MHIKIRFLVLVMLLITGCSKKQEVIFEIESVTYEKRRGSFSNSDTTIQKACNEMTHHELKTYLNDGWKVVASSPKEKFVKGEGSCVGTEYILEK